LYFLHFKSPYLCEPNMPLYISFVSTTPRTNPRVRLFFNPPTSLSPAVLFLPLLSLPRFLRLPLSLHLRRRPCPSPAPAASTRGGASAAGGAPLLPDGRRRGWQGRPITSLLGGRSGHGEAWRGPSATRGGVGPRRAPLVAICAAPLPFPEVRGAPSSIVGIHEHPPPSPCEAPCTGDEDAGSPQSSQNEGADSARDPLSPL
jgi:hypothetical protein